MALANYSDLRGKTFDWLAGKPIQVARFPDWLTLYEARANRELRTRQMETRATASTSSEYTALPTDFLQMRNVQLNGTLLTPLEMQSPEFIDRLPNAGVAGTTAYYAIVNDEIQLALPPTASVTIEMDYWAKIPALTAAAPTNWLMTTAPDAYLFGVLCEAAVDLNDTATLQGWEARYQRAVASLQSMDDKGKWSGATMVRRIPNVIWNDGRSTARN